MEPFGIRTQSAHLERNQKNAIGMFAQVTEFQLAKSYLTFSGNVKNEMQMLYLCRQAEWVEWKKNPLSQLGKVREYY